MVLPPQPTAPVYQELGPFTETLASVKKDGKWGFIDQNGKLVISAQYFRVLPFSEGLAGVDVNGRWGFINGSGATAISPGFNMVIPFSESLAPARTKTKDQFGFINKQGSYAITPQFDKALPFSQGLVPVYKNGKWVYINSAGAVALTTSHYRAYRFTADGLALVRPQQNGKYGFIARDGSLKLPAIYDEAFEFSSGLAPVRFGKSWAYIDTTGKYAIQDTYEFASPFSEGAAGVIQNGKAFYITTTGARLLSDSYDTAGSFVGGKALVKSGGITYYIDKTGKNLGIAQKLAATPKTTSTAGDSSCAVGYGVWNNYQGGFAKFSLVNTDSGQWNIKYTNLQPQSGDSPWRVTLIPGGPATLPATGSTSSTPQSFMAYIPSMVNTQKTDGSKWPHFQMDMTSADGNAVVTLYNYGIYNAPPSDSGTSWFDFVKGALDIIKGTLDLADGNIFGGLYDYTSGAYDLVSGASGDSSTGNKMPFGTGTFYVSQLSGFYNGVKMSPPDGSYCGGDSFTISDGSNLVVELSATRASSTPGEIDVKFYKYNTFYALLSAKRFNDWRDQSNGTQFITGNYAKFMSRVFANYADPNDTSFCQSPDKSQGFMQTVMGQLSYSDASSLFNLANYFGDYCNKPDPDSKTDQTWCEYWAAKLPYSCTQTSFALNPISVSSQAPGNCSWTVAATNAGGAITASGLAGATINSNTCTPTQSSCSVTVNANRGVTGILNISDGFNTTPLSVNCGLAILPSSLTGTPPQGQPYGNCTWSVQAFNTMGTLTAQMQDYRTFDRGTCVGAQDSCQFTVTSVLGAGSMSLSDGNTKLQVPIICNQQ